MPEIVVRELSPQILEDWLAFFDHEAFADNPEWSACYCHFFHADHEAGDWDERSAKQNRAASCDLITAGRLRGYLAYVGGKPAGWCHAAPRLLIPNLQKDETLAITDADQVGSVVCFVVSDHHRGRGLANRLLDAACTGFRAQGLAVAEAYPRKNAVGDAGNYHGPLSLYLHSGFAPFKESERILIVRKDLTALATV